MPDDWGEDEARRAKAALIDTTVPNAARVTDYLYGGQNNFEIDRKAARSLAVRAPVVAAIAPAVRAFQQHVLRFLVAEAGVTQFLDIGTGLPLVGSTHEVTQSVVPECRVAYVDNDPMVLSHARALLRSAPGGVVGYVDADVRDPDAIVAGARTVLDLSSPVAIMLLFTLAYVEDTGQAAAVVSALAEAVPSGSHVAVYHLASDLDPPLEPAVRQWNKLMPAQPITLRSRSEVARLVAGLDLVPPGLVPVTEWRGVAEGGAGEPVLESVPVHGVVARKLLFGGVVIRWRGFGRCAMLPCVPATLILPTLTAGPFRLRAFTLADVDAVREASADPHIPLITTVPAVFTEDEGRSFIERQWSRAEQGTGYSFAIADGGTGGGTDAGIAGGTGRAVGQIGLWLKDAGNGRASIGYWVIQSARGRGAAAASLRALAAWALDELAIPRLELNVEPWNTASVMTAERSGFRREGLMRSWQEVGGTRRDMYMYSRLPGDPVPGAA